jgi:Leucine-rich repeat (LRR) protein
MIKQVVFAIAVLAAGAAQAQTPKAAPQASSGGSFASVVERIEARGGYAVRDRDGNITEVSLARTWATDNDVQLLAGIKTIKKLDLSFTYVTDRGIKALQQLRQLEDLNLDTAEFVTDASMATLRGNTALRKLKVRGVDVTDAGMPYVGEMTGLRSLDLSYTMLGDVGLEHLPALSELEELKLGGDMITGLNLNFLKLLPKLKRLSLNGIQRRNAGACWTPRITDLDLETISSLSGLEELDLGVGFSLGRGGKPAAPGGGNCRLTGGLQITDLGLGKLAKLKNLKRLNVSGAKLTPAGLRVLAALPLERLNLWACEALDDSAAAVLAEIPTLAVVDLSYTAVTNTGLQQLAKLPNLKNLYLTDTKVTPEAVAAFRVSNPKTFVSWAKRPAPRGAPLQGAKEVVEE